MKHEPIRPTENRVWAAMMLALDIDACDDILRGIPVRVSRLDKAALKRTKLWNRPRRSYVRITNRDLDQVNAGGPFEDASAGGPSTSARVPIIARHEGG